MKLLRNLLVLVSIAVLLHSCAKEQAADPNAGNTTDCDSTKVTYCYPVKDIIASSCESGCHEPNGTGNGNFTTYSGIKAKVDNGSFENRVLVLKNMPPSSSLTTAQLQDLQTWFDNGAPEN
ncbi:MAG: hypothetical protein COC01_07310 [Bacteroidetes bacterium]|nr:MAG: hypothetical protein COC01_07310 [Bacteroidota bacterium]